LSFLAVAALGAFATPIAEMTWGETGRRVS
jgi:hypothetical protein